MRTRTRTLVGPEIVEVHDDRIEVRRTTLFWEHLRRVRLDEVACMTVSPLAAASTAAVPAWAGGLALVFAGILPAPSPLLAGLRIWITIVGVCLLLAALLLLLRGVEFVQLVTADGHALRFKLGGGARRRGEVVRRVARAVRDRQARAGWGEAPAGAPEPAPPSPR